MRHLAEAGSVAAQFPGATPESSEERSRDTRVVYFDLNLSPDSRIDVQMLDVEVVGKQLFAGFVAGIVKKQTNKPSWPFTCEDRADSHV